VIKLKKSDLRKIVKEELLKEFNESWVRRMEGLVDSTALKNFISSAMKINSSLGDDFEGDEIKEFLIYKINKIFK